MSNRTEIDQVLRRSVESGEVPGVVAMAGTAGGTVYEGAFGVQALPSGAPMTVESVFWIASMTKAITSAAAMQQVERGALSLDGPIGDVLPELARLQVFDGFDDHGQPKLRPAKRPVTLRHLLTHTAGFSYDIWNADLGRYMELNGIPGIISCQDLALTTPLLFDPGERWDYGINIDWAGKAVERVTGQHLEDYFREHIFGPLGMTDTGFRLSDERRRRLVGMHARKDDGSLEPMEFEIPQDPEFHMGGGGLYGTAGDYLKFQQVFLQEGKGNGVQLLRPETVREMCRNNIGDVDVCLLRTAIPAYSNDAEFFPGMVKKWGLGFMINTEAAPGRRSAHSLNWAGLGNTYFWIDPAKQVAGVMMTQLVPFADAKVLGLLDQFETAVYAGLA